MNINNNFQKIFASFSILYELLSTGSNAKYYLMVKPKMHLCYYKMKKYMIILEHYSIISGRLYVNNDTI